MAQTPMTLETVQPATATQTATTIELKSDRVTVTFNPATGMISRITSGGTEVPFKDGPVAVGMKMRYEPTLSYVRNSNEGAVYCAKYKGAADSIVWRLTDKGLLYMDAILLNRASGGGGFDDAFMDSKVFNLGLTFSYPEKNCSGMKWMGRGHSKQQPRPAAAKWDRGSILIITQSARANHGESCRKMEI